MPNSHNTLKKERLGTQLLTQRPFVYRGIEWGVSPRDGVVEYILGMSNDIEIIREISLEDLMLLGIFISW